MTSSHLVEENSSLLSRVDRALSWLETTLLVVSGMVVFCLMLLAVVSVGGRMLSAPLPGYIDYIQQAMPFIAFLGIAYALRNGVHVRMDIVVHKFKGRPYYAVEAIISLLVFFLMVLMVWGSWSHFLRSFDFAMPLWSRDSSFDIALPLWPSKLVVPVAFFVLCLRAALQILAYVLAFIHNPSKPIAVPLPEGAIQQASREAESVLIDE